MKRRGVKSRPGLKRPTRAKDPQEAAARAGRKRLDRTRQRCERSLRNGRCEPRIDEDVRVQVER